MDGSNGGSRLVVTELSHIKELVAQLEVHLGDQSPDHCKRLASQIFAITERSIGIITSSNFGRKRASATPSPLSDVVDAPFLRTHKKRKMAEKRRVSEPVDDGHSWRKYGQKEILGAKHPRGYYRCTHRHSQGCAATKQVQRTDEDPALFDVIYHGTHTCVHKTPADETSQPPERNPGAHSLLQNLSASLTVKTEELPLATTAGEPQGWNATTPFCFSSTPASGGLAPEWSPFSAPSTSENWGASTGPATPDSNHVSAFPPFEAAEWRAQFELQEVVSALMAASAPPALAFGIDDEFLNMDVSNLFV